MDDVDTKVKGSEVFNTTVKVTKELDIGRLWVIYR